MGSVFGSRSGVLRRNRNASGGLDCYTLLNHPGDVDSPQGEHDRLNGDNSALHRNQADNCAEIGERALIESSNAVACTNNINISNVRNVVNGDNTTINIQTSEQRIENITVVYTTKEPEERNTVGGETKVTASAVANDISVQDSYIVAIGNITFTSDQTSHPEETDLNVQRSVPREQLFPSPQQLASAGIDPRIAEVFDVMCTIVNQLYPLRDRGEWLEFETTLLQLQTKFGRHPEIKCFLLLEESIKLTYQKRFKAAKRKAKQSLNIVNSEESMISGASLDVLKVLGNVASVSIIRRLPEKKLGKAFKCLEEAKQRGDRLKNVNLTMAKFALALLDYELARWHMAFATLTNDTKHCNKEVCKTLLGRCIDRCRKLSDESQLYTARQSFAKLYLARLSLPTYCHPSPGQCKRVNKGSARQAEKLLDDYHRSHRDFENSPVAARVKYWMTRSQLFFMRGNYAQAKEFACQALETAEKHGFELETVPAQIHLDQICRHCASTTRQDKLPVVKELPSGYSSSTTTDSDQKYTTLTGSQRET